MAHFFKLYGFKDIKLKAGFENDLARLKAVRAILGKNADIRLDANGAWRPEDAIKNIKTMRPYDISFVEQPVEPENPDWFKKVSEDCGVKTMADESLRTVEEAERLASEKICHAFNIRLSKCGGVLRSLRIAEIARKNRMPFQIGCHVGETSILGAAGRHLATCLRDAIYLEGCYSRFLLRGDIVKDDVNFKRGGAAGILDGPGLGVDVQESLIEKYKCRETVLSI